MNNNQVNSICAAFNLGTPIGKLTPVAGGLLHRMWRLDTTTGSYAVKQLTKDIGLTTEKRCYYELSEQVAQAFKTIGIAAVNAFKHNDQHLFDCDNNTFLVYPWTNATMLTLNTISKTHATKIARLLAHMHKANLQIKELSTCQITKYNDQEILSLITQVSALSLPFTQLLHQELSCILTINRLCQKNTTLLPMSYRVSHADLDQKMYFGIITKILLLSTGNRLVKSTLYRK